jgi:hypothetical protein
MKKLIFLFCITTCLLILSCNRDEKSERFKMLTTPLWATDSLLANGVDASGPGGFLEKFKGDAQFKEDGTGTFGKYKGKWRFNVAETELTITTDSLPLPIIADIVLLTTQSLKIKTTLTLPTNPTNPLNIRMTFIAK